MSNEKKYSYWIYAPDGKTIIGDVFVGIYKKSRKVKAALSPDKASKGGVEC